MHSRIDGSNLVFVVGAPRSGTTYLQRLLAAHPLVKTGQESHMFTYIGPPLRRWQAQMRSMQIDTRGGVGLPCYFTETEFDSVFSEFVEKLLEPMVRILEPDQLFLEKTPAHALWCDVISELLPNARIIHLIRDARDVVASLLAASRTWGERWAPSTAQDAARMWKRYVISARTKTSNSAKLGYCEITYEQLVANPHASLIYLSRFLKLEWETADLEQAIAQNKVAVAKQTGGTPIPINGAAKRVRNKVVVEPNGFVRKGQPGSWKNDLTVSDKLAVWLLAHRTMKEFGYTWKYPWSS